jgi:hypothetical protein
MTMMLKCKRQEASFATVATDNAEFLERTMGCRLNAGARAFLESAAKCRMLFTYQELAAREAVNAKKK